MTYTEEQALEMTDLEIQRQKRVAAEYKVIANAVSILSVMCMGDEEKIIDLLTGYLWDEEEAGDIKNLLSTDKGKSRGK